MNILNIECINSPLPDSPLKQVNNFFLTGQERALLIDTSFNTKQGLDAILSAIKKHGYTLDTVDGFITHLHVDHSGLSDKIKTPNNKVYASSETATRVNDMCKPEEFNWLDESANLLGMPKEQSFHSENHVSYHMHVSGTTDFTIVKDGDVLHYGNRELICVDLNGHCPGQTGLWDEKNKILFGGDHVLANITPNISAWDLDNDYLGIFFDNLIKVDNMNLNAIYCAHRDIVKTPHGRIQELLAHHQDRLLEITAILKQQEKCSVYYVAKHMKWRSRDAFLRFSPQQKWFACSEAMAHLQHMYFQGSVKQERIDATMYYTLK